MRKLLGSALLQVQHKHAAFAIQSQNHLSVWGNRATSEDMGDTK